MKRLLGLVFAPVLAVIAFDPAMGKTVGPDGHSLIAFKTEIFGPQGDDDWGRRIGPLAGRATLFKPVAPLSPVVLGKQPPIWPVYTTLGEGKAPRGKIANDLTRVGGAQHRKALWPDLDFTGHGHRRGGKVRNGGGGWDEMPDAEPPFGGDNGAGGAPGGPGGNQGGGTGPSYPHDGSHDEGASDAISPVPLPAAGWLMVAALGGLAAISRRKTR